MNAGSSHRRGILIVEDEPLIALFLQHTLADVGFTIAAVAGTLNKALALIEGESFEAAVMDTNLGGVDASPAIAALRSRGVPYLIVSGYSLAQQSAAFRGAPFVSKPIDPRKLINLMREVIRYGGAPPASGVSPGTAAPEPEKS